LVRLFKTGWKGADFDAAQSVGCMGMRMGFSHWFGPGARLVLGGLYNHNRGAAKKKIDGPPRPPCICYISDPPTHHPIFFFLVRVWAFLGKGSSKTPQKYFGKKSVSKTFSKISTKISMSVFPRLFLFYRIFGCFSATGVQKHHKKRVAKKIVSKSFYKKFDQKSKTDVFSIFF
jgi:hypothetical protein